MDRRGGVNSLFKILQAQLNKYVSKTNGEAILVLAIKLCKPPTQV